MRSLGALYKDFVVVLSYDAELVRRLKMKQFAPRNLLSINCVRVIGLKALNTYVN